METFLEEVNKKVHGVPLQACYHCRKCTAGCPMTKHMEYNPNKVIKMIQNGQKEKVLASSTIWLCLSCETCITRCPNQVDIARMMDVLRQMAIEEGRGAGMNGQKCIGIGVRSRDLRKNRKFSEHLPAYLHNGLSES